MKSINDFLRLILRKKLALLSQLALHKHNPRIIVVTGSEHASLVREALYTILSSQYNTRRNLENPDSEFSIPLTILGELSYPSSIWEWKRVLIRNFLRVLYLKPHPHVLVIQIKKITDQIYNYWLKIIKPELIIDTSNWPQPEIQKLLEGKIPNELQPVLEKFSINFGQAESILQKNFYPNTRISIIPAKNNSYIIDARHYYHPPRFKTIEEIAETLGERKYLFSNIKDDLENVPHGFELKHEIPDNFPEKSVFIFRGNKDDFINQIRSISINELEI